MLDLGVDFRPGTAHRQPQGAARGDVRRRLHRQRRAARSRHRHSGSPRGRRARPHRHRLARERLVRPHDVDRQARRRAGRRQHGDGLLPQLAAAGRRRGAGRRALGLRRDEGVAVGEGRRDARGHPDPQLPRAEGDHARRRQADRRHVREGRGEEGREGPAQARPDRRAGCPLPVRRRAGRDRAGKRVPVDRARPRHRVRRERDAGRRRDDHGVDARRRVLRRRRGARAEEHHLGGRARPRRGDLDRPAVPRRGRGQASAAV